MIAFPSRQVAIALAMLVGSGLSVAMKPTKLAADQGTRIHLETMIPKQFGKWAIDTTIVPVQVSPDVQARLNKVYDQTLSRTYVHEDGKRIMLSIAYGGSHGEGMQTHRPEICYPAQGFSISRVLAVAALNTAYGNLPINRLVATYGPRVEPITYWVVVGDVRTGFGLQMKLAQLRYNFTGIVPDGMLVRVSSIDINENSAYAVQERFILDLLAAMTDADRLRIVGKA